MESGLGSAFLMEPSLSRRQLLSAAAACAAGAAVTPAAYAGSLGLNADLSRAAFEARLGARFYGRGAASSRMVALELVELVDGPDDPALEQFSVVLRDASGSALPEGRYLLFNPTCVLRLHLIPTGEDAQGASYCSATFAHLH